MVLSRLQVYALLILADGGGRLDPHAEHHGHTGGDAAQDAAGVVGGCFDLAIGVKIERVVVLAAAQRAGTKPIAEFHAFDSGDAK